MFSRSREHERLLAAARSVDNALKARQGASALIERPALLGVERPVRTVLDPAQHQGVTAP